MRSRLANFQATLAPLELVLLSTPNDIRYFTEFTFLVPEEREALLVVSAKEAWLIATSFSPTPPQTDITMLFGCQPTRLASHLNELVKKTAARKIWYQAQSLFVSEFQAIQQICPSIQAHPSDRLWQFRMMKDAIEIAALQQAGQIVAKVAAQIQASCQVGVTELELCHQVDQLFQELGAEQPAFPTIVAFGAHATSPHHQPDQTPLTEETVILLDCGARVNGYRSDLTRTWWFGAKPDAQFLEVEKIVKAAYQTVVDQLQLPAASRAVTAKQADQLARDYITQHGYGPQFIHTTGHGVGLDIHEPPSLSWSDATALKAGMTITVEPGIYLDGKFGYRFENTILLTDTGADILTQA